ncbi:MAG TPA: MFS transporter [Symbiobacteriaceae bacterium]|nr:MFS transporter [Symbiobacteriaceae bacterium]
MRLKVLLGGVFAFHAGWYMLVPFLAILFTARRGLAPAEVGLVLATQSFTLLLGSLAGGALSDRFGRKLTMVSGLVLRTLGLGALGLVATLPGFLLTVAVAGLGGGLYGPAVKAAIALLAAGQDRTNAFSWRGIAANVGTSTGPLAGAFLMRGPMPVLFGVAAVVHGLLAGVTWLLLPPEAAATEQQGKAPWREILADTPYLAFSAVTVLGWALFAQLTIAVPLYASRVLGLEASIGLLWTISSLAVILLQVPVSRFITGAMSPTAAMAVGVALLGAGLGLVGLSTTFAGLVGAVLVFVAGEMLLMPTVDSTVSLMATAEAVGSYFGVASFAWGLGEGLGNLAGGALMQVALSGGRIGLPWAVYGAAGLAVGSLFGLLGRWGAARARLTPVTPAAEAAARRIQVYRPGHPVTDDAAITLGGRPGEEE